MAMAATAISEVILTTAADKIENRSPNELNLVEDSIQVLGRNIFICAALLY